MPSAPGAVSRSWHRLSCPRSGPSPLSETRFPAPFRLIGSLLPLFQRAAPNRERMSLEIVAVGAQQRSLLHVGTGQGLRTGIFRLEGTTTPRSECRPGFLLLLGAGPFDMRAAYMPVPLPSVTQSTLGCDHRHLSLVGAMTTNKMFLVSLKCAWRVVRSQDKLLLLPASMISGN